ncbi:hypothetical protein [Glycomyces rhizosphaerae]|uniref:Uncharacterized protein n=1 Tax=Glycomyces rhizosphaerae TaxID=2054422 RepID=A0ABV7Q0A0_9ACTN
MSDFKHAPATLGSIEFDSARIAIREWVGNRNAGYRFPVRQGFDRRADRPATNRQTELTSIVKDAAEATAAALFGGDKAQQRQFLDSLLSGKRRGRTVDDAAGPRQLVNEVRHWMAERGSPLKSTTGMSDADLHRCLQELCEQVIIGFGVRAEHDREKDPDLYRRWVRFWNTEVATAPQEHSAGTRGGQFDNEFLGQVRDVYQAQIINISIPVPKLPEVPDVQETPERPSGRRRFVRPVLLIAALAVVAVAPVTLVDLISRPGRGSDDSPSNEGSSGENSGRESATPTEQVAQIRLEAVRSTCAPSAESVRVEDDGKTMIIERALAEEDPGIGWDELGCLFEELEMPDSVLSRVQSTNSFSGIVDDEWPGFTAFWTYHRDSGLHMTIEQVQTR